MRLTIIILSMVLLCGCSSNGSVYSYGSVYLTNKETRSKSYGWYKNNYMEILVDGVVYKGQYSLNTRTIPTSTDTTITVSGNTYTGSGTSYTSFGGDKGIAFLKGNTGKLMDCNFHNTPLLALGECVDESNAIYILRQVENDNSHYMK